MVAAEMVSPEELGVAVKATYPAWIGRDTARTVTIQATINGRYVTKTIPVTQYTTPGSEWDDTTMSGTFRVKPTTPIRINLREAGVPRFTDDVSFTVSGTASYAGGLPSRSSSTTADVRLPVLAYHGYNYPNGLRATVLGITLPDEISWIVAYKGFSDYLTGNWEYNRDSDWGLTWKVPLELKGYTDDRYVTLWDAEDSHLTYTNPLRTAPPQLRDDVQAAVDRAKAHSYADKVNLVGHSFGGLLSRYYASERPQYVNKVITVGSPMQGVTFALQTIFTTEASNRAQVEDHLRVKEGPSQGQPCALYWGIPRYTAVTILPPTPAPSPVPTPPGTPAPTPTPAPAINTVFTSTYTAPIRTGVDYHFIYATNHMDTPYKVSLQRNPTGQWYHVESVSTTAGDGTVITSSGGDIGGASGTNVHRHAVVIPEDLSHILNSGVVKDTIIQALLDIPAGSM
jgi:pimeloyl-ACP methyl ester carboxylesterase